MSMPGRDSVYEIYQQHFNSFDEGLKALNSQRKTLRRICKDYSSVVFVMGKARMTLIRQQRSM